MICVKDLRYGILVLAHVVNDWYVDFCNNYFYKLNYHKNKVIKQSYIIPDIIRKKANDKARLYNVKNYLLNLSGCKLYNSELYRNSIMRYYFLVLKVNTK